MTRRIAQICLIVILLLFFYDVFVVVFGDNHIIADCFFVVFKTREKPTVAVVICNINDDYFIVFADDTIFPLYFVDSLINVM